MKKRILMVNDETNLLEIVSSWLLSQGFDVLTVSNSEEALKIIITFNPSIIITDMNMPTMTGLDVMREVRTRFPDLPVVIVSANPKAMTEEQSFGQSVFAILEKPFRLVDLLAICEQALE